MSILGHENAKDFLRQLDEKKLLNLCADILSTDGHTGIKITDGTGDGQRDIRSITPRGENYLTQSKYHHDISQAVSASEIGEVVAGMLRFGYKKGLFITTARITPQAKRDLLEHFPGYEVDYLDGWELVKKVFSNLVLKAIWYDGVTLDKVSYTIIVPVVARDLATDKPVPILPRGQDSLRGNTLNVGDTHVQTLLKKSAVSTSVFGQYRQPRVRTVSEIGSSRISLTEVVLSGVIYLKDVGNILNSVGFEVVHHIKSNYPMVQHFAVMVGRPCLTPLGGESSGARIELEENEPIVLVYHDGITESELDWILPTQELGWFLPIRPSISQADWIRWYNPTFDICVDITVVSPPSEAIQWMIKEQSEYFIRWWNESLFMLLPTALKEEWKNLLEPSYWYQWDTEKSLGVWLHPNLGLSIRLSQIEPDDEPLDSSFFQYDPEQVRTEMHSLKTQIEVLGGVIVEPSKARHMIAILDKDPFITTEITEYPGRYLVYESQIIPSPINPQSRRVQFTTCWLLKSLQGNPPPTHSDLNKLVESLSLKDYSPFSITAKYDDQTLSKEIFIIAEITYLPTLGFEKTASFLESIERDIDSVVLQVEEVLRSGFHIQRATECYWDQEILMTFKCVHQNSSNNK
jgi:hypothetical protein